MSKFGIYMIAAVLSTNFVCSGGYGLEYFTVEQIMKDNLAINAPGIYYPDVDIGPDGVFVDYECRSTDVFDMADDIGVLTKVLMKLKKILKILMKVLQF